MSTEPIIEAKPEVVPEVSKTDTKDTDFTTNFERISKQEKFNSENRKQLEEKRKAFETDKAELEKYRQFDKELKVDPLGVMEKLGLSLDRIQQLANERHRPQNPEARQAIEIAKRLENELKQRDERDQQEKLSREEVKLKANISNTIKTEGFDILEHLGMESAVQDFMETYYEETGEIPSIKDACEAVTKEIASKLVKVKDSKWLQPKQEESLVIKQVDEVPKAISNKMVQTSTRTNKPQTESERMAEALRIMRG